MTGAQPVAAILAGGDGARLNRSIKPLVLLAGQPLLRRAIARLTPQTAAIALSLRRDEPWAKDFGLPVITDAMPDAGPAAGLLSALLWAKDKSQTVLTCTADCPFLPADLSARLAHALDDGTDIVVAASGGQRHHLIALWRTPLADAVAGLLRRDGAMAINRLQRKFRTGEVSWTAAPSDPFFNINTPGDLTEAERICSSEQS